MFEVVLQSYFGLRYAFCAQIVVCVKVSDVLELQTRRIMHTHRDSRDSGVGHRREAYFYTCRTLLRRGERPVAAHGCELGRIEVCRAVWGLRKRYGKGCVLVSWKYRRCIRHKSRNLCLIFATEVSPCRPDMVLETRRDKERTIAYQALVPHAFHRLGTAIAGDASVDYTSRMEVLASRLCMSLSRHDLNEVDEVFLCLYREEMMG